MTYKQVTSFDRETGRLFNNCKVLLDSLPEDGFGFIDGYKSLTDEYIDLTDATVKPREASGATLSADSITLGQSVTLGPLPMPCTVYVSGAPVVVEDGTLEITPQSIGDAYRLMINEVEYLRETWFFEVLENED